MPVSFHITAAFAAAFFHITAAFAAAFLHMLPVMRHNLRTKLYCWQNGKISIVCTSFRYYYHSCYHHHHHHRHYYHYQTWVVGCYFLFALAWGINFVQVLGWRQTMC